jgi:hypothetical protein
VVATGTTSAIAASLSRQPDAIPAVVRLTP